MLISCEKCSTTYVLDEALIPPQGAPVQCTRCGHVFTARVTPAEPPPTAPKAGNSTMMFGAQQGPPVPPPAAPPPGNRNNQTMMFGTAASNVPAPPPPAAPASAARNTMMFGNAPAAPPPAAKNQTMVFGTAASNAAPPQAPAAPANARSTMMFGSSQTPPPAAPPAPAAKQTMVFGTAASNAAAQAPAAPVAAGRTTIMFGGNQQPPAAAPPAPAKNQTMMFGTPASNAAPPPAPAVPPPAAKQTLVFGGAPAAPAKNQTMMFGTAASLEAELPEAPVEETILEQPGQSGRTVMFGNPIPPEAPAPAAKNQTMMFGRPPVAPIPKVTAGTVELAGYAADENAPSESTVRVDVQQVIEEHEGQQASDSADTGEQPELQRHDRTQRYAMTSDLGGPTPPEGISPVQDRHNRTQLFAMSNAQEPTVPVGASLDAQPGSVVVESEPTTLDLNATLPAGALNVMDLRIDMVATLPPDAPVIPLERRGRDPEGVSLLQDPANLTPPEAQGAPVLPQALATTLPNLGPVNEGRPMEPLSLEMPQDEGPRSSPSQLGQDDAAALRAARGGGAGRIVVIVLALVALALLGVLVYRLFGAQLGLTGAAPTP